MGAGESVLMSDVLLRNEAAAAGGRRQKGCRRVCRGYATHLTVQEGLWRLQTRGAGSRPA